VIPGLAEYVFLRLLRRFLFSDASLVRFGQFIPYYRPNANQSAADSIVDLYAGAIVRSGLPLIDNRSILEIGAGATNSVGYALLRRQLAGPKGRIYLFEPHAELDPRVDVRLRKHFGSNDLARVERILTLAELPHHSIDLVLSHSVLEHVSDMDALLASLDRVLSPAGSMIHAVDYRDHFFKYPYHFLLFQAGTWERWLNPWRSSALAAQRSPSGILGTRLLH
jgi:SAM-dependent methyltransferase